MGNKRTVVLMWDPRISSLKESDYTDWFNGICTFREKLLNWSVWDHGHIGYGDRFLLVRIGDEKAGLMMEGIIASDCYEGEDWADGDQRKYYVDLVPVIAYNPENGAVYPLQSQLQKAIPGFDWSGGHSGRVLTDGQEYDLDRFICEFKASTGCPAKDLSKVRNRDYIIPPSLIYPTDEEKRLYPAKDPRPFIESLIMQSMGIPADRIEKDWEIHKHRWLRGHENLLQTAAWLAFPIRATIPYYGALCLKLSHQYWGKGKSNINAAYAKEAADFLTDRKLRHSAILNWLAQSLRMCQNQGTNYAISPLVRQKVTGVDILSRFIGYDVLAADDMLHDYYVRNIEINTEHDYINIEISYASEGNEEEILIFHIADDINIDVNFDSNTCLYIDGARIGPWGEDYAQLLIGGYALRGRGRTIDIRLKNHPTDNITSEL